MLDCCRYYKIEVQLLCFFLNFQCVNTLYVLRYGRGGGGGGDRMNRQGSAPPFSGGYGGNSRWDALKDDGGSFQQENRGSYNNYDGGRGGNQQNYNRDVQRGNQGRDSGFQINNRWDNRTEYNNPEGGYPEATKDNWTVPLPKNERLEK